jgi:transcriptional regulator NrdR family protein
MDHHLVRCPKCGSSTHVKVSTVGNSEELMSRQRQCDAAVCRHEFDTVELTQDRLSYLHSILYRWNQMFAWVTGRP